MIPWDLGHWRDCFHQNPPDMPEPNTMRKMHPHAIRNRSYSFGWGVINPCNALWSGVFRTKREAEAYRRALACVYVVVRVIITPIYTQDRGKHGHVAP